MGNITLTLACGDYDRVAPLKGGRVKPEGVNLNFIALGPEEIFFRMARHQEFDASEMSLASYINGRARGRDDLIAIPVFPSRMFRHSAIFVHTGAGIEKPEDLKGRRVGVGEYQMTAIVWVKGILSDDHGAADHRAAAPMGIDDGSVAVKLYCRNRAATSSSSKS